MHQYFRIFFVLILSPFLRAAQTPLGDWQAVATNSDGSVITAAMYDGSIYVSLDSGNTWIETFSTSSRWFDIAMSSSGQYQLASTTSSGQCAQSFDYGLTWTYSYACSSSSSSYSFHVSMDYTGKYQGIASLTDSSTSDYFYISDSYGSTWSTQQKFSATTFFPYAITVSSTGQYILAANYYGNIYSSSNYGSSWSIGLITLGNIVSSNTQWTNLAYSEDVGVAMATSYTYGIFTSTDQGITWYQVYTGHFIDCAGNQDGSLWVATDQYFVYVTSNSGSSWSKVSTLSSTSTFYYTALTMSSDSNVIAIAAYGKCIFISYDQTFSWTDCIDTASPTSFPTISLLTKSPSVKPTIAPSGPTVIPTRAPTNTIYFRPTQQPVTRKPTANATKPSGLLGIGNLNSASSAASELSFQAQIAVIVVVLIVVCCCCIPGCYYIFFYRPTYNSKKGRKRIGGKTKRKRNKHGQQYTETDEDDEEGEGEEDGGYIEHVKLKKGAGLPPMRGVGGTGIAESAATKKNKDPFAARKKKKAKIAAMDGNMNTNNDNPNNNNTAGSGGGANDTANNNSNNNGNPTASAQQSNSATIENKNITTEDKKASDENV
jgi:hypothetical protein